MPCSDLKRALNTTPAYQNVQIPRIHPGYITPVTRIEHQRETRRPPKRPPKTPYIHHYSRSGSCPDYPTQLNPHLPSFPLPLRTTGPRTHREPPNLIPHLGNKHQIRLQRLLLRLKRLVAIHPHLEIFIRPRVLECDVVFARRPLLERDCEAPAPEPGHAADLLQARGF